MVGRRVEFEKDAESSVEMKIVPTSEIEEVGAPVETVAVPADTEKNGLVESRHFVDGKAVATSTEQRGKAGVPNQAVDRRVVDY